MTLNTHELGEKLEEAERLLVKSEQSCYTSEFQLDIETKLISTLHEYEKDVQQAKIIIQDISEAIQESTHAQLTHLVTRCLEVIFKEDAYKFKILFNKKKNKTEAILAFERDGVLLQDDPLTEVGLGVIDVASFALRLSCLLLRPGQRKLLILDEPFKFVSEKYRSSVRELLETLSEDLGVQIIMVTHCKEIICGKVINIEDYVT